MEKNKLRIAAIGDLHVHETFQGFYKEMILEISDNADVLLLCGDLTNLGLPKEAEVLAADLAVSKIPVLAVLGNHDYHHGQSDEIKKILGNANVIFLDEDETFEINEVGFAGMKGFAGGFGSSMLGSFGEDAIKHFVSESVNESLKLENALNTLSTEKIIVVLHYSPILDTLTGELPEIYPFLGCSRLAETIDRYNVTAVFHGHIHKGSPEGKTPKGIKVYNCAQDVTKKYFENKQYIVVEV